MRVVAIAVALMPVLIGVADAREDMLAELLAPWPDTHASPHGTPHTHAFNVEPAYLHRGLRVDYLIDTNVGGDIDEQELGFELEWALTKRLGLCIEAPLIGLNPVAEQNVTGFGDMAVAGRVLLVDRHCFLLSANVELETPTGDAERGLGRGEAAFSPTVLCWMDLGHWTVFQGQLGPETGLDSGETELLYRFALTRTWQGPVKFPCRCRSRSEHGHHDHNDHGHHGPGLTTLYLETVGDTNLSDRQEGTRLDMTTGIGYYLTEKLELRTGLRFPLCHPKRFDSQFIFSAVRCF